MINWTQIKNTLGEYGSYPKLLYRLSKANRAVGEYQYHRFGDRKSQYLLAFTPTQRRLPLTVVFIHGGGWNSGSPKMFRFLGQRFANMGYNTVLLGYRHAPRYKYPAQAHDIFAGLALYRELMLKDGFDLNNLVVIGPSAGAHLAGILVYHGDLQQQYGFEQSIYLGFIPMAGPLQFVHCQNFTIRRLLNGLFPKGYHREQAEPYALVRGHEPTRVLCVHSQHDPLVPSANSTSFVGMVNSHTTDLAECTLVTHSGRYHSNLAPGVFLTNSPMVQSIDRWISMLPTD